MRCDWGIGCGWKRGTKGHRKTEITGVEGEIRLRMEEDPFRIVF
jgi:hypothetical protein